MGASYSLQFPTPTVSFLPLPLPLTLPLTITLTLTLSRRAYEPAATEAAVADLEATGLGLGQG